MPANGRWDLIWHLKVKPLTNTVFNSYLWNFVYIDLLFDYFYIHVVYDLVMDHGK